MWKVGDRSWLANAGIQQVTKPCPVCAGKLSVELILGTGDHVILPCDYCGKGYSEPLGRISEYEYVAGVEQLTITEVRTTVTEEGEKSEYLFAGHRLAYDDDLCATEAEALDKCEALCLRLAEEQITRAENIKANVNKSYSWNAGYHLREAKREEESAARHRARATICKEKSKDEKCGVAP